LRHDLISTRVDYRSFARERETSHTYPTLDRRPVSKLPLAVSYLIKLEAAGKVTVGVQIDLHERSPARPKKPDGWGGAPIVDSGKAVGLEMRFSVAEEVGRGGYLGKQGRGGEVKRRKLHGKAMVGIDLGNFWAAEAEDADVKVKKAARGGRPQGSYTGYGA
jgi:hypothetical protein